MVALLSREGSRAVVVVVVVVVKRSAHVEWWKPDYILYE